MAYGIDKLVREFFRGDITMFGFGAVRMNFLRDSLHQMGFAQTDPPVNKKWIVRFGRIFSYCQACSMSKTVRGSDNKIFKIKPGIKVRYGASGLLKFFFETGQTAL